MLFSFFTGIACSFLPQLLTELNRSINLQKRLTLPVYGAEGTQLLFTESCVPC